MASKPYHPDYFSPMVFVDACKFFAARAGLDFSGKDAEGKKYYSTAHRMDPYTGPYMKLPALKTLSEKLSLTTDDFGLLAEYSRVQYMHPMFLALITAYRNLADEEKTSSSLNQYIAAQDDGEEDADEPVGSPPPQSRASSSRHGDNDFGGGVPPRRSQQYQSQPQYQVPPQYSARQRPESPASSTGRTYTDPFGPSGSQRTGDSTGTRGTYTTITPTRNVGKSSVRSKLADRLRNLSIDAKTEHQTAMAQEFTQFYEFAGGHGVIRVTDKYIQFWGDHSKGLVYPTLAKTAPEQVSEVGNKYKDEFIGTQTYDFAWAHAMKHHFDLPPDVRDMAGNLPFMLLKDVMKEYKKEHFFRAPYYTISFDHVRQAMGIALELLR